MLAGLLRVLVIGLVLLVGAMVWTHRVGQQMAEPEHATRLPEPKSLPVITLVGQDAQAIASSALFQDRFTLLFFGFTNCPDICPTTLRQLADLRAALDSDGLAMPDVLFISVDATRDTPEQITRYLANFDPGMRGATAAQDALAPLLESLGVVVHAEHAPGAAHYTVTHSSAIFVIDPDGRLAAVFTGTHTLAELRTDVTRLQQRYRRRLARAAGAA